ncbi:MAG: methylenetetrahydrofolate reductase C-terminal domain-containing protein [Armatimonadetes bacterium]|nr:methylenetetrahydrofolate reductase C-terminal domain-containing protein [Armatimonadota bacterium]
MTITEQKEFEEILRLLEPFTRVFIVGCGECATLCQTGGEYEVEEMKKKLAEAGKHVTGSAIPDAVCEILDTKRVLRQARDAVAEAEALLVLCCGAGVQAVVEAAGEGKHVIPGCNTLFLGDTYRKGQHYEWCSMCTECVLGEYGGICPITRCPKGQTNGPCGGTDKGKCEVDPEQDCVWTLIFERAKALGVWTAIADRKRLKDPKDYSRLRKPRKRIYEPRRAGLRASTHSGE